VENNGFLSIQGNILFGKLLFSVKHMIKIKMEIIFVEKIIGFAAELIDYGPDGRYDQFFIHKRNFLY
jgi:hypothetical protein